MSYAHVQTAAANAFTVAISATTAGNHLIATVYWSDSSNTNPTLTGFTGVGTKVTDAFNISSRVFYKENIASGITSVAVASWDNGTPGTQFIFASEYSGLATSSSLITFARQAVASPGAGTDACSSGSTSVAAGSGALIYSVAADVTLATAFATGTANSPTSRGTGTDGERAQDYRATGTASQAGTFTANPAGASVWMVAFAEAASGGSTTITPTSGSISTQGRAPTINPFTNVRIREVLLNASGQVVANAANIRLMVWYSGQCVGAADYSVNGQTSDANGTTSWSVATGTLVYNQAIFYVAQDSVSYVNYTCARMTPSYE